MIMAEGKRKSVILEMNGDDFKKLVEQREPNELINTIPEILDFLRGIRDDETLEQYIKRIVASIFTIEQTAEGNVLHIVLD